MRQRIQRKEVKRIRSYNPCRKTGPKIERASQSVIEHGYVKACKMVRNRSSLMDLKMSYK
jgi:hypothetical protein